jgi:hypothetical protein
VSSRVDRALELAERLVDAFERIADALERSPAPRRTKVDERPRPVRTLSEKGANDIERVLRKRGM